MYTLTNQIPLLELMRIDDRRDYINIRAQGKGRSGIAHLGDNFEKFIQLGIEGSEPRKPVEIVAFTDRNDLLSYDLKCWYYLNVLRFDEAVDQQIKQINRSLFGEGRVRYEWFGPNLWRDCEVRNQTKLHRDREIWRKTFWNLVSDRIKITSVTVNISDWEIPTVITEPASSHSNYFKNNEISKLIDLGKSNKE